jgi:TonB family protein
MTSAHTKLRLLCGMLCAAAVCSAQATKDAQVSPPRLLYKVKSEYSKEAREARVEGAVVLALTVGADGKPRDLKVLRSLELGLVENAIVAVSKWQFAPGAKDGHAVDTHSQIEVNFRLADEIKWRSRRLEFHLADGATRPTVKKVVAPRVTDDAVSATATLTFDVNEKGQQVNFQVEKTSDNNWASEVTAALLKWRFIPASKDGVPISVSCTMEFVRGTI